MTSDASQGMARVDKSEAFPGATHFILSRDCSFKPISEGMPRSKTANSSIARKEASIPLQRPHAMKLLKVDHHRRSIKTIDGRDLNHSSYGHSEIFRSSNICVNNCESIRGNISRYAARDAHEHFWASSGLCLREVDQNKGKINPAHCEERKIAANWPVRTPCDKVGFPSENVATASNSPTDGSGAANFVTDTPEDKENVVLQNVHFYKKINEGSTFSPFEKTPILKWDKSLPVHAGPKSETTATYPLPHLEHIDYEEEDKEISQIHSRAISINEVKGSASGEYVALSLRKLAVEDRPVTSISGRQNPAVPTDLRLVESYVEGKLRHYLPVSHQAESLRRQQNPQREWHHR